MKNQKETTVDAVEENTEENEEEIGLTESVNPLGQLEIGIDLFHNEWDEQYNGKYIFDRVKWKHRGIIFDAQKAVKSQNSIQEVMVSIAKKRGVQVKHVQKLMLNDELTDKEEQSLNAVAESSIDLEKMYSVAPTMFNELFISGPVDMKDSEKLEDVDMSLVQVLFTTVVQWAMKSMTVSGERRKK